MEMEMRCDGWEWSGECFRLISDLPADEVNRGRTRDAKTFFLGFLLGDDGNGGCCCFGDEMYIQSIE